MLRFASRAHSQVFRFPLSHVSFFHFVREHITWAAFNGILFLLLLLPLRPAALPPPTRPTNSPSPSTLYQLEGMQRAISWNLKYYLNVSPNRWSLLKWPYFDDVGKFWTRNENFCRTKFATYYYIPSKMRVSFALWHLLYTLLMIENIIPQPF